MIFAERLPLNARSSALHAAQRTLSQFQIRPTATLDRLIWIYRADCRCARVIQPTLMPQTPLYHRDGEQAIDGKLTTGGVVTGWSLIIREPPIHRRRRLTDKFGSVNTLTHTGLPVSPSRMYHAACLTSHFFSPSSAGVVYDGGMGRYHRGARSRYLRSSG